MKDNEDIPVLTDLIEEKIDVTIPELGLGIEHDMVIAEDEDEAPELSFDPEAVKPAMNSKAATRIGQHAELEQTVRRILDEHMELAWQEIRLAIELALNDDKDDN